MKKSLWESFKDLKPKEVWLSNIWLTLDNS